MRFWIGCTYSVNTKFGTQSFKLNLITKSTEQQEKNEKQTYRLGLIGWSIKHLLASNDTNK